MWNSSGGQIIEFKNQWTTGAAVGGTALALTQVNESSTFSSSIQETSMSPVLLLATFRPSQNEYRVRKSSEQ
jgi:hypothetical protein